MLAESTTCVCLPSSADLCGGQGRGAFCRGFGILAKRLRPAAGLKWPE